MSGQAERPSGSETLFDKNQSMRFEDRARLPFQVREKDIIVN